MTNLTQMRILAHVPNDLPDLVSTAEAARILRRSVATVNRMATDGRLAPVAQASGITGARFFRRSDIDALLSDESAEPDTGDAA